MNKNFIRLMAVLLVILLIVPNASDARETRDNRLTGEIVFKDTFITISRHENHEVICYLYKGVADTSARFQCQFK